MGGGLPPRVHENRERGTVAQERRLRGVGLQGVLCHSAFLFQAKAKSFVSFVLVFFAYC